MRLPITYIYIIVWGILISSCSKDWLEEKPDKTLTVPETLDEFQGLLDYVVKMNQQFPIAGEIASDYHYVTDQVYKSSLKGFASDAYIWKKENPHLNVSDWNQSYAKILIDNIVIDGLDKLTVANEIDQLKWNNIKGQALFNRARVYFDLAQIFTPQYDSTRSKTDLGLVLRLTSDITITSQRSSLQDTYAQIISDLKGAIDLLPDRSVILTRGSKAAAFALLARIYLVIGDYQNALQFSNYALDIHSDLLNFNELPKNKNFIGRYVSEVLYHTNFSASFITRDCLIDSSLLDLYNVNDLRRAIFFKINSNGTITFKGNYELVTSNLFNGIATDEVYLIRAECLARNGDKEEAMHDLNTLYRNRWDSTKPYIDLTAIDADDALRKILLERRKELLLRGLRWSDLRRLNRDSRFAVTLTRTVDGITYTLEPNSYKYTFPIPDDIISQTGMPQNSGWK